MFLAASKLATKVPAMRTLHANIAFGATVVAIETIANSAAIWKNADTALGESLVSVLALASALTLAAPLVRGSIPCSSFVLLVRIARIVASLALTLLPLATTGSRVPIL